MTLEQFHALQTEAGGRLLAALAQEPLAEHDLLSVVARYRRDYPAELVSAAIALTQLRRRARAKFTAADTLFFTREGLEMSSAESVARHTAQRFSGLPFVLDLCCGIGGDALALADAAPRVVAVDRDPLALEMARANAHTLAFDTRVQFVQADVSEFVPGGLPFHGSPEAIFIDPSRRESRAAARKPENYSPPISWCLRLLDVAPRVAIKVSPALDFERALGETAAEIELVSLNGEAKEGVLWLGDFRTCARRATVLPADATLTDEGPSADAIGEVGGWLYEPDPAVIRAHLVQRLAGECGLRRIDAEIAYLTGDAEVASPFLAAYRVRDVLPWSLKRLNAYLAEQHIGHAVIKKRGFPLTPDELRPKLKLTGPARATLVCTRAQGKPVVIVCA